MNDIKDYLCIYESDERITDVIVQASRFSMAVHGANSDSVHFIVPVPETENYPHAGSGYSVPTLSDNQLEAG